MPKVDKKTRKSNLWNNLQEACIKYNKALFVNVDNVTSKQICILRKQIRETGGKMVMGKNTMMKCAINDLIREPEPKDADYAEKKPLWKARPHWINF